MSLRPYRITIATSCDWHGTISAFSPAHACEIAFELWHNAAEHPFQAGPVETLDIDADEAPVINPSQGDAS